MQFCKALPLSAALFASLAIAPLHAQLYWDTNGATAGAGTAGVANGTWDLSSTNWNASEDGSGTPVAYTAGSNVIFSAGSDTTTASISISASTLTTAFNMTVESGSYTFSGSQLTSLSTLTVDSGATVNAASVRLNGAGNPTATINGSFTATDITSNGTLTKEGSGQLTSNGRLDGNVIVNGGILSVNGGGKTKSVTINDTGTFLIAGNNTVIDTFSVAVAAGGTLQLGSGVTDTINNLTGAGTLTGGSGSVLTVGGNNGTSAFSGSVGGAVSLVKNGTGTFTYDSGASITSIGNTTVSTGTFNMADGSAITFTIGADGVNNAILGTGTANLEGAFNFNLDGADLTDGNSWLIVDVNNLTETFASTFFVNGFTQTDDVWTDGTGFSFSEATGVLSYAGAVIPEPSTFALLGGLGALGFAANRRRRAAL